MLNAIPFHTSGWNDLDSPNRRQSQVMWPKTTIYESCNNFPRDPRAPVVYLSLHTSDVGFFGHSFIPFRQITPIRLFLEDFGAQTGCAVANEGVEHRHGSAVRFVGLAVLTRKVSLLELDR